ncbi:catalase [Geomicrobium sp. JCM 19039]|uniref:catalase n=1 Tax=Geomicrobium sp. JCM 19039 TaxID=1460636 RepID=UPI00045F2C74|nr:catalase [Geomicrobium sp. JCM 19039]GAK13191.1 catalase [Geomicrobium sp. JCM 19039]
MERNWNKKDEQLKKFTQNNDGEEMASNEGTKISNDENTLKAGERGPTLHEDFLFQEKLGHFDRERIPERVVHARGYGAHGEFRVYKSLAHLTKASFLQDPNKVTPVFVRFSQVAGSRGANETNRDVRGFAAKFYTEEGNFDLVGNNIPVFFIQDSIKFPDLIHAVKPEPHNEIPQGQTAHDTFWDFIGSNTESAHMMMWIMSDRTIPRSFRMMEGFGVHTFRLVNREGTSHFVKFHWKPVLGAHSLTWDEAQKIGGADPDYHRRDLWENIEMGNFAEYELGIQVIAEDDEFMFDFDILDATKLWPEEEVPVQIIGKMTLNRNVDNVFAETEQIALHPGQIVPGIDFSNDPLLQGRIFSYADTQLYRVGTNYQELPINRPVCPIHNNQRDGQGRITINQGQVAYHNNSLADNTPSEVPPEEGGFSTYRSTVKGFKERKTAPSFKDHYSQARLFWNSMSPVEKDHIIEAFSFELGKVKTPFVRQHVVNMLGRISSELAAIVAKEVAVNRPKEKQVDVTESSPALSLMNQVRYPNTLKVGVIIDKGFAGSLTEGIIAQLEEAELIPVFIGEELGDVQGTDGVSVSIDDTFLTGSPLLYDGLLVVGGKEPSRYFERKARTFIRDTYNHFKPIGALGQGAEIVGSTGITGKPGVLVEENDTNFADDFISAMATMRFWERVYRKA